MQFRAPLKRHLHPEGNVPSHLVCIIPEGIHILPVLGIQQIIDRQSQADNMFGDGQLCTGLRCSIKYKPVVAGHNRMPGISPSGFCNSIFPVTGTRVCFIYAAPIASYSFPELFSIVKIIRQLRFITVRRHLDQPFPARGSRP